MDVDHFKKFNDAHGHQAGDEVLRGVGKTLQQVVKLGDFACRYGGEEFGLVMPNTPINDARVAAERIRKAIESLVVKFEGKELSVNVSVGLAEASRGEDAVKLIGRADAGVYISKEAGRNCGHWHDGDGFLPMDVAAVPQEKPAQAPEQPSSAEVEVSVDSTDLLPDRDSYTHELQRRIAECHRFGVTLASMHIVVKNYAGLEKEFGNAVGQLLLNAVARFIRTSLRDMDLLAKIKPGEFAIMLPGSSGREGKLVAARIQTAISSCAIPLGDKEIQLQLDIGVCGVEPGDDAERMIERARAEAVGKSDQTAPVA
jgi:diguanylate cyclase